MCALPALTGSIPQVCLRMRKKTVLRPEPERRQIRELLKEKRGNGTLLCGVPFFCCVDLPFVDPHPVTIYAAVTTNESPASLEEE